MEVRLFTQVCLKAQSCQLSQGGRGWALIQYVVKGFPKSPGKAGSCRRLIVRSPHPESFSTKPLRIVLRRDKARASWPQGTVFSLVSHSSLCAAFLATTAPHAATPCHHHCCLPQTDFPDSSGPATSFRAKKLFCAKLPQLCPTLCNTVGYSPPGSSVPRILQARILEWVAISLSKRISYSWSRQPLPCQETHFHPTITF